MKGANSQPIARRWSLFKACRAVLVEYMMIDRSECLRWSARGDRHVDLEHDPARAAVIAAAI